MIDITITSNFIINNEFDFLYIIFSNYTNENESKYIHTSYPTNTPT